MGPPQSCTTRVTSARPAAAANCAIQSTWARTVCAVRRRGLVGAAEPDEVRRHRRAARARPGGPRRCGRGRTTSVGRAVAGRSRLRARPFVDVVHAQPVGQLGVTGARRGSRAARRSSRRGSGRSPRRSSCPTAGTPAPRAWWTRGRAAGSAATSPWSARAWSGLSLAYELACLGARVTVSTPRTRAAPPTPARGSCRRDQCREPIRRCGPSCTRPARTTRPCSRASPPTAPTSARRTTRPAASSRSACAPTRTPGSPPSPTSCCGGLPARWRRSPPDEAAALFPPLGPVHRVAACARFGPRRRARHGGRAARGRGMARGVTFVAGAVHGVVAGAAGGAARRVGLRGGPSQPRLRRAGRRGRGLDGGRGRVARLRRSRWARRRGRSCISASSAETGDWPIAQPLLTHYLVPWPGGRVACGGTFETGAGFSVSASRPAGCTSCCGSAWRWRPG